MLDKNKKIVIAGAGLVGSLLALRLAQRGFEVCIYESRPDMRIDNTVAGRSINLALSHRGIQTLKLAGVDQEVLKNAIQMQGRMIHALNGDTHLQKYSSREGEYILSISRKNLNIILLNALEKIIPGAVKFEHKLEEWNARTGDCTFITSSQEKIIEHDVRLIGTDGANSAARKSLMEISPLIQFNYQQVFQNYGYKELNIPPGENGVFQIEKNALHIWPHGNFMMIALPNPDATFTCTLFLPYHGSPSFDELKSDSSVSQFFFKYFPDAKNKIENLEHDFFHNPTGHLYTVKCFPWSYEDKLLLLGDAAHAIIPFYGQGMNCGFEDIFVFDQLMEKLSSWEILFSETTAKRKPNSDSIADLAEDNFVEMRDKVADPVFQRKRKLETEIEKRFPDYYSKYALVTFRPDVSYFDAMTRGRKQDELLMDICSHNENFNEIDIQNIYTRLKSI